jgi:hypothetical protein
MMILEERSLCRTSSVINAQTWLHGPCNPQPESGPALPPQPLSAIRMQEEAPNMDMRAIHWHLLTK